MKNIDFMGRSQDDSASTKISSAKSIGSFVKASQSNLIFENMVVSNLYSDSSGAFLNIDE